MSFDQDALSDAISNHGRVVRIVIAKTEGSVPRGAGAAMLVWDDGQSGTIGGGKLEFEAIALARQQTKAATVRSVPLGPALGQCCGGSVTLISEVFDQSSLPKTLPFVRKIGPSHGAAPAGDCFAWHNGWLAEPAPSKRNVWIYGAGHVGRAMVNVLAPLPDVAITWVDTAPNRFPDAIAANVSPFVAAHPPDAASHAPHNAEHLILTYDHQFDLALCHALLQRSFGSLGLIGSATKWARFRKRLAHLGHAPEHIGQIACPIGDTRLGKHPQQIAIGVAMAMLGGLAVDRQKGTG